MLEGRGPEVTLQRVPAGEVHQALRPLPPFSGGGTVAGVLGRALQWTRGAWRCLASTCFQWVVRPHSGWAGWLTRRRGHVTDGSKRWVLVSVVGVLCYDVLNEHHDSIFGSLHCIICYSFHFMIRWKFNTSTAYPRSSLQTKATFQGWSKAKSFRRIQRHVHVTSGHSVRSRH